MARVIEDGEWEPREWRMPAIPAEVRRVKRKDKPEGLTNWHPHHYEREGDTRFWVYVSGDGRRNRDHMTEKDMIVSYGPLVEVREEEQHG
jgi:hypothetical protein